MNDRYRLGGLANDQLLASLNVLARRENDALSDMLAHLAELDERGLCLELGYSSLFKYCTEALGFCNSSAGRRIAAARVCRQYPDAFAMVANGELKLSVLCALNKHLNLANASELFALCSCKSYEQVELLLAARFPKPDVRDLIRRLPARPVQSTPHMGRPEDEEVGAATSLLATSQVQPELPPRRCNQEGTVKPIAAERFSVHFTADSEFRELLEEVRALISHAEPRGDLASVMKRGLQALKSELMKKRFGVGRKPQRVRAKENGARSANRTRHVAARVARVVWQRDDGQCTFGSADGRRCSERRFLQLDHVQPYAKGGEGTENNLRLRCRAHNLHAARVHFGKRFMLRKSMRARAAAKRRAERRATSGEAVGLRCLSHATR